MSRRDRFRKQFVAIRIQTDEPPLNCLSLVELLARYRVLGRIISLVCAVQSLDVRILLEEIREFYWDDIRFDIIRAGKEGSR